MYLSLSLSSTRHFHLCDLRTTTTYYLRPLGWVGLLPHAGLAVPDAADRRQYRHEQEAADWKADGQAEEGVTLRCYCRRRGRGWQRRWGRRGRRAWRRRGRRPRAVLDLDGTTAWARGARVARIGSGEVLDFGRADDRRAPVEADPHDRLGRDTWLGSIFKREFVGQEAHVLLVEKAVRQPVGTGEPHARLAIAIILNDKRGLEVEIR